MNLRTFKDLYWEEMRDLYDAEHQLLASFGDIINAVALPDLKQSLSDYLTLTREHVEQLERIFSASSENPLGNPCKTMVGLIEECGDLVREERRADPGVLDAAIIAAVQKVAHFEMAGYGCARTFASILHEHESAGFLDHALRQHQRMNDELTQLAMSSVNPEAAEATAAEASGVES
jgi:ferritin-like metal-binding protein YciE